MNRKQQEVVEQYPQFNQSDFRYFRGESEEKVESLGLPVKTCGINDVFSDAFEAEYHRREYCLRNCGLKCLTGEEPPEGF